MSCLRTFHVCCSISEICLVKSTCSLVFSTHSLLDHHDHHVRCSKILKSITKIKKTNKSPCFPPKNPQNPSSFDQNSTPQNKTIHLRINLSTKVRLCCELNGIPESSSKMSHFSDGKTTGKPMVWGTPIEKYNKSTPTLGHDPFSDKPKYSHIQFRPSSFKGPIFPN